MLLRESADSRLSIGRPRTHERPDLINNVQKENSIRLYSPLCEALGPLD